MRGFIVIILSYLLLGYVLSFGRYIHELECIIFAITLNIVQHPLDGFCNKLADRLIEGIQQIYDNGANEKYLGNGKPRINLIKLPTIKYNSNCISTILMKFLLDR